jgi:cytochrome b6-f complex iron-sulfur subunit
MTTERKERPATLWTRRDLLTRSGWFLVLASWTVSTIGSIRLLFPRVSFTPRATVVVGYPDDFAVGEVVDRWKETDQFFLVRDEDGFFALRSVCTHLGCIPRWIPGQDKFKCPCHGSGFHPDGVNFEGPAPRPLERMKIALDEAGRLVVDTARTFRQEKGEWDNEFAFVRYPTGEGRVAT